MINWVFTTLQRKKKRIKIYFWLTQIENRRGRFTTNLVWSDVTLFLVQSRIGRLTQRSWCPNSKTLWKKMRLKVEDFPVWETRCPIWDRMFNMFDLESDWAHGLGPYPIFSLLIKLGISHLKKKKRLGKGLWLMIAFITCKSNLVLLLEGLCSSNPCRFKFSVFLSFCRNWTDDLEINSPALWPTELVLHRLWY